MKKILMAEDEENISGFLLCCCPRVCSISSADCMRGV